MAYGPIGYLDSNTILVVGDGAIYSSEGE